MERCKPSTVEVALRAARRCPGQLPKEDLERVKPPTPEEIRERCAAVRSGWSAEEEQKRAGTNRNYEARIPTVGTRLETYDTDQAWEYLLASGNGDPTGLVYGKKSKKFVRRV